MTDRAQPSKTLPRAIGFAVFVFAITAAAYIMLVKTPADIAASVRNELSGSANDAYDLAKRIAKDIDSVLHFRPHVTSSGATIVEGSRDISELSMAEKTFIHHYTYQSTWLGSKKRIQFKGSFIAKAGFLLDPPLRIDISPDGQTIRVFIPQAKIHSVEQVNVEVEQDDSGWWNQVSKEDREIALNGLQASAKKSLADTSLLNDAREALLRRMQDLIRKSSNANLRIIEEEIP